MGQESAFFRDFVGTRSSSGSVRIVSYFELHRLKVGDDFLIGGPLRLPMRAVRLCASRSSGVSLVDLYSPSRKASLTPCTSLGGASASASKLSMRVSRIFPPPSCLMLLKASESVMKIARISADIGVALGFWVSEVLTSSRLEKKVERSGRRVCWGACSFFGMLCSTMVSG